MKGNSPPTPEWYRRLQAAQTSAEVDSHTEQPTEQDKNMLSIIVSDALDNIDIATAYPTYYQRLLAEAPLRTAFLAAVDHLRQQQAGQLAPLPTPSRDLQFLYRAPARPKLDPAEAGHWSASWTQFAAYLQMIFTSPAFSSEGMRNAHAHGQEPPFQLLHSELDIAGQAYQVRLEATPTTECLQLTLVAFRTMGNEPPPALKADLQWGAYTASATLDAHGQARFPLLPLTAVLDAEGKQVAANLLLSLATVS